MTLVDDAGLVVLLTGGSLPTSQGLATTFLWWWRLSLAVRTRGAGALSGPFGISDDLERAAVVDAVDEMPARVEIVDPVILVPVAADLAVEHGLNALAAEAIAAALVLEGEILVRTDNPRLGRAARALGVDYRVA